MTVYEKWEMMKAVNSFMDSTTGFIHDIERENKFGVTVAKYGYWIKNE